MPKKIKGLAPSLREKKRYIKLEIIPVFEDKIYSPRPMTEVIKILKNKLGLFDAAKAGIVPVKYFSKSKKMILRVATNSLDKIRAILLFIDSIGTQQVIIRSIQVSGAVNKVMEEK